MNGERDSYYDDTIDLRQVLLFLPRHWRLIVGLTLVATMGMAAIILSRPDVYEASSLILVGEDAMEKPWHEKMIDNPLIAARVIAYLEDSAPGNIPDPSELPGKIEVEKIAAGMVEIVGRDKDPAVAATLVNAWSIESVEFLAGVYQVPEGSLRVVVSASIPETPISRNLLKSAVLAGITGFMLAVCVAYGWDLMLPPLPPPSPAQATPLGELPQLQGVAQVGDHVGIHAGARQIGLELGQRDLP